MRLSAVKMIISPLAQGTTSSCPPNTHDYKKIRRKKSIGRNGAHTSQTGNGELCVKITVPMERLGKM
jgi:hypothetical protein